MKRFEDKKYSKTKQTVVILLLVTAMSFAGCGQTESSGTAATPAPTAQAERIDTGFVVTNPDSYDSADTAVLVDINNVDNTVTLLNLDLGKRYNFFAHLIERLILFVGGFKIFFELLEASGINKIDLF